MKYRYTSPIPGADPASKRRVPLVKATLLSQDNKRVTGLAMVDSGADICVFSLGYAVALGIDLRTCEQVVVNGVEGVARDCYKTTIDLGVEGLPKITVAVLFIDSSGVDGLLGQEGFFDQHIVTFNRHNDSFEVVPNLG